MDLHILPLAITMMAGPQILSAIIFVSRDDAVPISLAFLAGVLAATAAGVLIMSLLASAFHGRVGLGDPGDSGSTGNVIQIALVALLIAASFRSYRGRRTSEPPKWLGKLQHINTRGALTTGALLILLMPSDVVILLTVGTHLETTGESFTAALPFIGATALIAALPLLVYLLFGSRARRAMPKVRNWMNTHSWLINIGVYCLFIALILL
jgi:hypothetical protein